MAISLANFIELLPIEKITGGDLEYDEEISGLGSGEILSAEISPPVYTGTVKLRPIEFADYPGIRALFKLLDGSKNSFEIYIPPLLYPQDDPTGSILGSSTVTIYEVGGDNKSLRLEGLPDFYQFRRGDQLCFNISGRRVFHEFMADSQANDNGRTPLFEVRPHLFPGTVTTLEVTLKKPTMFAVMVPRSKSRVDIEKQFASGLSFDFRQRFT